MKLKRSFAAILAAAMLICPVQLPASADSGSLFAVNDETDAVEFRNTYDFAEYLSTHKADDADAKKYNSLNAWYASGRTYLFVPDFKYDLRVRLTPKYVSVWFPLEKESGTAELIDYYGSTGRKIYETALKSKKSKKLTTAGGIEVYFVGDTAKGYRYYWKQSLNCPIYYDYEYDHWEYMDRYFELRISDPENKPEYYPDLYGDVILFVPSVKRQPEQPTENVGDISEKMDSGLAALLDKYADDVIIPVMIYRKTSGSSTVSSDREFVEKYISKDRKVNVYESIPGMIYAKLTVGEIRSLLPSPDVDNIDYFEEYEISNDETQVILDEDNNVVMKIVGDVAYGTDGKKYNGWRNISDSVKYYYREGLKVTKPCTIDGIFYKFDKGGVCKGRYTGFAKTAKGMVYYKNGVRVKNKTLRTKDGTRYKADKYGYLTKILKEEKQ